MTLCLLDIDFSHTITHIITKAEDQNTDNKMDNYTTLPNKNSNSKDQNNAKQPRADYKTVLRHTHAQYLILVAIYII